MTKVIGYDEAVALLKRAVAEKGENYVYTRDAVYNSCQYVRDGKPSCIVGHVIGYASWDALEIVAEIERKRGSSWPAVDLQIDSKPHDLQELSSESYTAIPVRFTEAAAELLREVQLQQDNGESWGNALKAGLGLV